VAVWVVKLGGSLQKNKVLAKWLDILAERGRGRVVIVPGGGKFADQVRLAQGYWNFDDSVAHQMAVLGMHQFGLMLSGLDSRLKAAYTLDAIRDSLKNCQTPVWLPELTVLEQNRIPASWDITSDSLAAWLATYMKADHLILVKSAEIRSVNSIEKLVEQEIVDRAFGGFVRNAGFGLRIFSADQVGCFVRELGGEKDIQGRAVLFGDRLTKSKVIYSNR